MLRRRLAALPWTTIGIWSAVLLGAALRLRHFLANRSLWLDEALLANALLEHPLAGLTRPLSDNQAAPFGYLLTEHVAVWLFGSGEPALRLVALLCSLAALPLFVLVARRLLSPSAVLFATLTFALSRPELYYAAEVKPYGPDVLVALIFLLMGVALAGTPTRATLALSALAGSLLIWCSYPAILMASGVGVALCAHAAVRRDRAALLRRAGVLGLWVASFVVCYLLTIRPVVENSFLQAYWSDHFAPLPPRSLGDLRWYLEQPLALFGSDVAGFSLIGAGAFLALFGVAALARTGRLALALCVAPIGFTIAAAALRHYPFEGRLLIFLAPGVLLLVAEGLLALHRLARPLASWLAPVMALLLLAGMVIEDRGLIVAPGREELRPVLEYVSAHRAADDRVYIYYGAEPATRYYAPRLGLDSAVVRYGSNVRHDLVALQRELAGLSGRTWVVFAHVYDGDGIDEERFALYLLDSQGVQLQRVRSPSATAYLYDLGEPEPTSIPLRIKS